MALTVEDGTGLANADSYVSVTEYDQYLSDYGYAADTGSTTVKEVACRVATQAIDAKYQLQFKGNRKKGYDQSLEFPRELFEYSVAYTSGLGLDALPFSPNEVPVKLKQATIELARRYRAGTALNPDVTSPGIIKRTKSKVGGLEKEVEYQGGSLQETDFVIVTQLLSIYLMNTSRVDRA